MILAHDLVGSGLAGHRFAEPALPGTGHLPNMVQPEAFNRVVLEFLERVI